MVVVSALGRAELIAALPARKFRVAPVAPMSVRTARRPVLTRIRGLPRGRARCVERSHENPPCGCSPAFCGGARAERLLRSGINRFSHTYRAKLDGCHTS